MPRMNPAMLLKMREQITFEIQQTQRTLGFIDPADTQMQSVLKQQQEELTQQLKDINEQLKNQGVPIDGQPLTVTTTPDIPAGNMATGSLTERALPSVPRAQDPTLIPGGLPQTPADPNLLIQRQPPIVPTTSPVYDPKNPYSQSQTSRNEFNPIDPGPNATLLHTPGLSALPTEFDQDQAWNQSPWAPQPSKELAELKQTVDSLRKELAEMKTNIKALETQIQLLNRNILLSQPGRNIQPTAQ